MSRNKLRKSFERLLDAIEAERAVMMDKNRSNSDRETAQEKVLDHMRRLQKETNLLDMLQRRLVVEIRGTAKGSRVKASDLSADPADYRGDAGGRRLHAIIKQTVFDCGFVPIPVAALLGADVFFTKNGYKLTGAIGKLSEPVPVAGRNADNGPAYAVRIALVNRLGYTAGYEGRPTTRRLTTEMFKRARRFLSSKGVPKAQVPMTETVRDWCKKTERAMFEGAYLSGCADLKAGVAPDPTKLLPK